jgi:hypothetical protein
VPGGTDRNAFDRMRAIRRALRPIEAAQVRCFGRSVLSLAFRTPVLLLHTTGRTSGVDRTTTLAYDVAEPITARTYEARSCGMRGLLSAGGSSGSAEPVEELAGRMRATGAGARSLCARWLSASGAAFAGERR